VLDQVPRERRSVDLHRARHLRDGLAELLAARATPLEAALDGRLRVEGEDGASCPSTGTP